VVLQLPPQRLQGVAAAPQVQLQAQQLGAELVAAVHAHAQRQLAGVGIEAVEQQEAEKGAGHGGID
jgi:hypothetical protein